MSPERVTLARAITRHAEAVERLKRLTEAQQKNMDLRIAAHHEVEKREGLVAEARSDQPHRYVASLVNGGGARSDSLVAAAERDLQKAEQAYRFHVEGSTQLEAEREAAERQLSMAESALRSAITAVVKASPEAEALVNAYKQACQRVLTVEAALKRLGPTNLPDEFRHHLLNNPQPVDNALATCWTQAIAKLANDAQAPLPDHAQAATS